MYAAQHIPSGIPSAVDGQVTKSPAYQCDLCHTTAYTSLSFTTGMVMSHTSGTAYPATTCVTCHNGSYTAEGTTGAKSKANASPAHIPTTITDSSGLDCTACHYYPSGAGIVISATGFAGKNNGGTAAGETMNHNLAKGMAGGNVTHTPAYAACGGPAVYCVTCHLTGASKTYEVNGAQQISHNGASTAKDCSNGGCHKPCGGTGSFGTYTR